MLTARAMMVDGKDESSEKQRLTQGHRYPGNASHDRRDSIYLHLVVQALVVDVKHIW